ncbi:hypothetical protein HZS_5639 [Henneguya salminicola]|nr:hypothetical protein HZS_5639 [Henneguya salminicola]
MISIDSHYSIFSLAQGVLSSRDKTIKFCVDFGLTPNAKFCSKDADALPENATNIGLLFLQETVPGFLKARWPWKK